MQLRNSRALGELLSLRALPSYDRLRDLYYVVVITERFSAIQTVSKFASCHGARPADYYRLVERATGCRWSEVKRNGLIWTKAFALTHWGRWILSK
ncbi:MAG: hypothetical protein IT353_01760 [Gemmatimonadaceae bacterium]|nr:hypothetical protein [Gemmatimonadaceae bacterium]